VTIPLQDRVAGHGGRVAIVDPVAEWSFAAVDDDAVRLAGALPVRHGDRVAILATPGHDTVVAVLACWHAGAIAVPLHPPNPDPELAYVTTDCGTAAVIASSAHRPAAERLGVPVVDIAARGLVHRLSPSLDRPALMIYTSGTTGRPKGAVHTHGSLAAMVDGMIAAWGWTAADRTVLVLPLNHVHGLVNVTLTALAVGATCEAPGGFDATQVWERLASGAVTVFMAVPTIYARLTSAWDAAPATTQRRWSDGAAGLRLMVSGSAALPVSTLDRWRQLTGHTLLERYGMTELGMVLSNTLERRVPGHVGEPMPGVVTRLVDDAGRELPEGEPGELLVRGPQVFAGYWERPEATAEAFVDGWFRTGDVAVHEEGGFRLLGRSSVDIIKSGGEKVSALEIEEVYRTHPDVADVAVVGLPDEEWGQRVAAAVVARVDLDPEALRAWGKEQLAAAKVPTRFTFVTELPRNTLGKVVKPEVAKLFQSPASEC
jgi:malonyl-CoA/methylmalonyl-CoA synthetase